MSSIPLTQRGHSTPKHPFALKRKQNNNAPMRSSYPQSSRSVFDTSSNIPFQAFMRKNSLRNRLNSSHSFRNILNQQRMSKLNILKETLEKESISSKNKDHPKTENKLIYFMNQLTEFMKNRVGDGGFRAAIFGLSDGLATTLCLIIGIQFAIMHDNELNEAKIYDEIVRTGIAGIFGGALSMALGEYISMSAQSEAILSEIEKHKNALEDEWDDEMDVLREILSKTLKEETIDKIMDDFEFAEREDVLELNSKIALGIDPDEIGSGFISGLWSFIMFSIGGIVPLSPYFWTKSITVGAVFSICFSLVISIFIGFMIGVLSNTSKYKTTMRQFFGTIVGVAFSMIINWLFNA
eukprot:178423_1